MKQQQLAAEQVHGACSSTQEGTPPLAIAGALQLPPVSSHSAQGAIRAAMDAADPALEPAFRHKAL